MIDREHVAVRQPQELRVLVVLFDGDDDLSLFGVPQVQLQALFSKVRLTRQPGRDDERGLLLFGEPALVLVGILAVEKCQIKLFANFRATVFIANGAVKHRERDVKPVDRHIAFGNWGFVDRDDRAMVSAWLFEEIALGQLFGHVKFKTHGMVLFLGVKV